MLKNTKRDVDAESATGRRIGRNNNDQEINNEPLPSEKLLCFSLL
jgi:hypothetical protein